MTVPDGQLVHLYIAWGGVNLDNTGSLEEGAAVRLTAAGAPQLTADPVTRAEVLILHTEPA